MRFGHSPMTYDLMINEYIGKFGLDSLSKFKISDLVTQAADYGFQHFEISLDLLQIFPISLNQEELKSLQDIAQTRDITYSVHFPFLSIDLATPNKFIRDGSVNSMVDAYNSVSKIESLIESFVLHPAGETTAEILNYIVNSSFTPVVHRQFYEAALNSITKFIERTKIDKEKLVIENIEFPLESTIKLIETTNTKLCLDTAHLLGGLSGNHDLIETLNNYYDFIGEIHLQDYTDLNPMGDHAALGEGKNFPPEFLGQLSNRKFVGPVVFELPIHEIQTSCDYIRQHYPRMQNLPHL